MRHRKAGIKLGRTGSHRNAMFRNMVTSLFKHDRIKTTDTKAKELRRWADQMITLAKRGDLHARRQAMAVIREKTVVHKLFEEAQERFGSREGGYTRLTKLGRRAGDGAPMTMVELISPDDGEAGKKKKKKAKKKAVDTAAAPVSKKQEPVAEEAPSASETDTEAAAEEIPTATAEPEETSAEEVPAASEQTEDAADAEEVVASEPEAEPSGDDDSADEGELSEAESKSAPDEEDGQKE